MSDETREFKPYLEPDLTERTREHLARHKAKRDAAVRLDRIRYWYWFTLLSVFLLQSTCWGVLMAGRIWLGMDYQYASLMALGSLIVAVVCATQVVGRGSR